MRESLVSRNHTELMFQQFGINLKTINSEITLSGQEEFEGKDINVPGDFSSAAFMIVGAPTIMKAADEKSPGTLMSLPSNSSCPERVISELIVFKFMPNCWNINSV